MAPGVIVVVALVGALVKWLLWIGAMNEHKSEVGEFMREIRADIKRVFQRLPAEPIGAASPRTLTDYGETIRDVVGAVEWATAEALGLVTKVQGMRGYEIEDLAFDHARSHDLDSDIREAAFEHGFTVDHVRDVLAVVLRDELLARRSE